MTQKTFHPVPKADSDKHITFIAGVVICYIQLEQTMDEIIMHFLSNDTQKYSFIKDQILKNINFSNKIKILKKIARRLDLDKFSTTSLKKCGDMRNTVVHRVHFYNPTTSTFMIDSKAEEWESGTKKDFFAYVQEAENNLDQLSVKLGLTTFKEIFKK